MDMRGKLLALGVFGLFAAALVWVAFSLQQAATRAQQELAEAAPPQRPRSPQDLSSREISTPRRVDDLSDTRVEALRTQVERLAGRLKRLSALLEQKTADYDELKKEFDQNAEMLRELLASRNDTAADGSNAKEKPQASELEMQAMLAELNAQLRETRAEVASLEKEAALGELHIFELEDQKRVFETTIATALVRTGKTSAPALADLLTDRRVEVRRWAAVVLAEMGPDAEAAVDALHDAASDSDEEVRIAARRALRRIEEP